MRGGLHRGDECFASEIGFQTIKFLIRNDDNLLAFMYSHKLGAFSAHTLYQFIKMLLGIFQLPSTAPVTRF